VTISFSRTLIHAVGQLVKQWTIEVRFPVATGVFSLPHSSGAQLASNLMSAELPFPGIRRQQLVTHHSLSPMPRLGMRGASFPLSLYAYMVWCLGRDTVNTTWKV